MTTTKIPLQETFDTVVAHLRKQGKKSETPSGCAYRGDGGLKCAVGCLIPDDRYSPVFESFAPDINPLSDTHKDHPSYMLGLLLVELGHDTQLCRALQSVHDDAQPCEWESMFPYVARRFTLTHTPPTKEESK